MYGDWSALWAQVLTIESLCRSMFVEILAEKKWLCSSLLRWIQVAANKTYCLLCLPQTILCEWMKLGLIAEKDHSFIHFYMGMSINE